MLSHPPAPGLADFAPSGRSILTGRREATPSPDLTTGPWLDLLFLTGLGALAFFLGLGWPGLMDPDEGRYAEIAREMPVLGDWLVPRLNFVPYLEKPPLVYWLTAAGFHLFGIGEWAARLPAALSALGGVYLAYGLGRAEWGRRAGLWGALVLATSTGFAVMGRLLTLDMTLALFLNLAVALGYLAYSLARRHLLWWAYAALALAALTKGPVAPVLAGLIWGGFTFLDRRRPLTFWLHPGGLVLFAALTAPWFLLISLEYPGFARFFFWDHHVGRFVTAPIHGQPVYYYLPVLAAFLLPWTWLLPWSLARVRPWADPWGRFLLVWVGVVLVFFSLSRGKLAPYIVPALLPLSLIMGWALAEGWQGRGLRASLWVWLAAGLLLAAIYLRLPPGWSAELAKLPGLTSFLVAPILIFLLTPAVALAWRRLPPLGLGALALTLTLPWAMTLVGHYRSPREAGLAVAARWQPGAALVGVRLYSQGLTFYAGQPMHLLDFDTELDFGQSLAPESGLFFPDWNEMLAFARSRPQVFFLVREKGFPRLKERLPGHWEVVARHKDCLLAAFTGK